ncbi:GAF domain-containing protein [Nocardia sp. NPDC058176]|uniref:GAF domain-containing protein n=1 Tax=Nocardia sp. NPDC058176 TaxID=3346368 RepID=UPI0036DBD087
MTWYLVESLDLPTAPMSIVAKEGDHREWSGIRRFKRDEGVDLLDLLIQVRRHATPISQTITGAKGPRLVEAIPIVGVDGDVYGIHVWVGETEPSTPPRPAAAIRWNSGELQVQQQLESWMMSTDDADGFKRVRSPGEFFRKVVRFDKAPELIQIATKPVAGHTFDATITVLHDRGHLMCWQIAARTRDDEHSGMRALTHDITDVSPPEIGPLETLGLTAEPDPDAPAAALLAFPPDSDRAIIALWVTKAPSWVDWLREGDIELIHPDDQRELARTTTILAPDLPGHDQHGEIITQARIRAHTETGWQPVSITSRRYPGPAGERLHIIRICKIDQAESGSPPK